MRITATSDLHGNLEGMDFSDCDIAIIAGDFALLKGCGKWHWNDQKKWINKHFIPFLNKFPSTQFCIIPGNHDMCLDKDKTGSYPDINFDIDKLDNMHILIDQEIEINGLRIYGTPWVPVINFRWAFESNHTKLKNMFSKIPENLDILITHTPPYIDNICGIDRSLQWGGDQSYGSVELTVEILHKKPKYVFCGHIHSGYHGCVEYEGSKLYNVSRVDENYEIAYEPLKLEI